MRLSKDKRDRIVAQALQELVHARLHKQGKVFRWQKNEDMYYAMKVANNSTRANVELSRMQEFTHTLLSKIDNPLSFTFTKRKESQARRVQRLNALRTADATDGDWDIKDIAGKKQGIIYGRAVYCYYADSYDGIYQSHLTNTDVYDFLVDPAAGGLDLEKGRNLGRYGVIKDKSDLIEGVKQGIYLKDETRALIEGGGNSVEYTTEEQNKRNRVLDQNVTTAMKESGINTDKYIFWEWFTTYEGERYYLLLQERSGAAIVVENLQEKSPATKQFKLGPYPFWTWASFPDLTEFWTPSYCDYAREIFMAQATSINQAIDNSEQINKPQKAVDVSAIENLAELKYRRDGYIQFKKGTDITKALQVIQTPSIDTPLRVFEILDTIQEKASGVTAADKGISNETKVGIYEGNQAAAADRFGLLNKSYSFGYKRFAKLYELGVREHLSKKVAVDIIGPNGIETEMISKRDIFRKDDGFGCTIQASDAEEQASDADKKNKITFLDGVLANPLRAQGINQKKAFEMEAKIVGFNEDEIRDLLDVSQYGTAQILSQADEDLESLLDGKTTKPNKGANVAYKQRFVDFMNTHEDDLTPDQFTRMTQYLDALEPIIMQNAVRELQSKQLQMQMAQLSAPQPTPTQPVGGGGALQGNPVQQ